MTEILLTGTLSHITQLIKSATFLQSIGLILFHILVLQEYWVLTESRIPLKPVLGA